MSTFKFGKKSLARLRTVNPILYYVASEALKICEVDFGVPAHGGKRTADEQKLLFDRKSSKADGFEKLSKHQLGDALDFYAYIGKASWELADLQKIVDAMKQVWSELDKYHSDWGIEFGMDWKNSWDAGHVQLNRIALTD